LPGPITKDEEEVAETLYALAGMLPDNDSNTKSEPDSESLPENSRVFQDQEESQSANVTVEGFSLRHGTFIRYLYILLIYYKFLILSFAFCVSCVLASGATTDDGKRSPKGCKKLGSLSETIGHEQTDFTDFPDSANFLVAATQSTVPKVNLQAVSMVKSENGGRVALHDSELSLDMGWVVFQLHSEIPLVYPFLFKFVIFKLHFFLILLQIKRTHSTTDFTYWEEIKRGISDGSNFNFYNLCLNSTIS